MEDDIIHNDLIQENLKCDCIFSLKILRKSLVV